jgi:hypothetical protein
MPSSTTKITSTKKRKIARISMKAYSASIRSNIKGKWHQIKIKGLAESKDENICGTNGIQMEGIYLTSHMAASIPYPGVIGVNIHAFTLCRGVLRHQQSQLAPQVHIDASQVVLFYPLRSRHPDLLMSVAPTDPSPTCSMTKAVPSGEHR